MDLCADKFVIQVCTHNRNGNNRCGSSGKDGFVYTCQLHYYYFEGNIQAQLCYRGALQRLKHVG